MKMLKQLFIYLKSNNLQLKKCLSTTIETNINKTPILIEQLAQEKSNEDTKKMIEIPKLNLRKRQQIANILKISKDDEYKILVEHPKLRNVLLVNIKQRLNTYLKNGIELNVIVQYPWLLLYDVNVIKQRLSACKQLPYNLNDTVTLLVQSREFFFDRNIKLLLNEIKCLRINRIEYLHQRLNSPVDKICFAIGRYSFFMALNFQHVVDNLNVLLENGVSSDNIMGDFWIFKYNVNTIKIRLKMAHQSNISIKKTWMVRCQQDIYNKTLKRHHTNKIALGDLSSIEEYLADRLNLDVKYTTTIVNKHSAIKRMNVSKAKDLLDYLYSEGYTPAHIIRSPRILCCKLETIKRRQDIFKAIAGCRLPIASLNVFCKSQQQFDSYLQVFKKKLAISNKFNI